MIRFVTTCVFAAIALLALTDNKSDACPVRPAKAVVNVTGNAVHRTHGLFCRVGHRAGFGRVYYHTVEPAKAETSQAECAGPNCPAPTASKSPAPVGKAAPKATPKK